MPPCVSPQNIEAPGTPSGETATVRCGRKLRRVTLVLSIAVAIFCIAAQGQEHEAPARQRGKVLDRFLHTGWTVNEGAPSAIAAIAQTTDGYLWLGTPTGLVRFDGIRFEQFEELRYSKLPFSDVSTLLATPDGGLWIGYRTGGVSLLKNGQVANYGEKEGLPSAQTNHLTIDADGLIWMSSSQGLLRFEDSHWSAIGADWGFPAEYVESMLCDRQGSLWVGTRDMLFILPRHAKVFRRYNVSSGADLVEGPDGKVWMTPVQSTWIWPDRVPRKAPGQGEPSSALDFKNYMAGDGNEAYSGWVASDGSVWTNAFGPRQGIFRIPRAGWPLRDDGKSVAELAEHYSHQDGLTDDVATTFLEDREHTIWIGTRKGLDRFRRKNVYRGPAPIGDSLRSAAMLADSEGALWAAKAEGDTPLMRIQGETVAFLGQPRRTVSMYRDAAGAIWIGGFGTLARFTKGSFEDVAVPPSQRPAEHWKIQAIGGDAAGAIWVSIIQNGVYRLRDGVWEHFGNLALPHLTAFTIWSGPDGKIWFGYTGNRMALLDKDKVRTFSASDGLAVGNVLSISGRGSHLWAGGQSGLALFNGDRFQMVASMSDGNFDGISGIVETDNGDLWLNQAVGIVHINAEEIQNKLRDSHHLLQWEIFDSRDGLQGTATQISPLPSAVLGTDGRIWIGGTEGVSWIDPAQIYRNPLPPPVSIQSVIVDGRRYSPDSRVELPPLPLNLQIDYTALSLSIPERVRFRYQLEGVDKTWQEVGTRRAAFYTNLSPGHYTFHVLACNNDGVWNQTGAVIDFAIRPAFYQSIWFKLLCFVAAVGCLFLFYLFRLKQLTAQIQKELGARLEERERIARDLHDTLLQGFQGLVLRFQAVMKTLPADGQAHEMMDKVLNRADDVLLEGRQRVRDLREEGITGNELSSMLARYGEELARDQAALFSLALIGTAEPLDPTVRSEAYCIGREALNNAFQYARAAKIEAEITFDRSKVRLIIRDDGGGIDKQILQRGLKGHWGLSGMQERAQKIGAQLNVWSQTGTGTEIDLTVPAKVAYLRSREVSFWHKRKPSFGREDRS